ncbi:MAG: hypothetical protein D6723_09195 [Acidobacteria bacterium]|nr:MAG: hypothetical protein D6723_09195 [Acidobacteriota bacterium]
MARAEPHRGNEHQATDFTDDHRKKKSSVSICGICGDFRRSRPWRAPGRRGDEKSPLEDLGVLCAFAVDFRRSP